MMNVKSTPKLKFITNLSNKKLLLIAILFFLPASAFATCSGSGASWSCTAGSTASQIQSAINSASDGATITFATGSYAITGVSLNNRNGITLICATAGGCNLTASGDVFTNDYCAAPKTNLMRISGFNFTGSAGTAKVWIYCNSNISQLRIDHNTFSIGASEIAVLLGEISATGRTYGVLDHNTFNGASNFMGIKNISGGDTWLTGQQGTANNFFIEDNTWNFTNFADLGTGGVDVWKANGTVVRYNTFKNSRIVNHSYCHGGPANSEIYRNTISAPNSAAPEYRNIHFQGSGEELAFDNVLGSSGNSLVFQHFRGDPSTATSEGNCNSLCDGTASIDGNRSPSSTYHGYPCWHQPGRDGAGTLKPLYVFMNRTPAGAKVDIVSNSGGYTDSQVAANRDFFNAVSASAQTSPTSPFNGTSGVGFGTLANRPTTCTANSESADAGKGGVGYWATDQGSWNKSGTGSQGVLYRCSATNTWTVAYTPYTYPHPLVSGGTSPTTIQPPTAVQTVVK